VVVKGQPTRLTLTAGAAHNRDIADETDYAACRTIMLNASRNYSIASRFLPADRRRHVEALYALLRVGDDRVDVSHEGFDTALAAINDWERAYWHAFETGTSPHPVMRAYLDTAARFEIPPGVLAPYFRAMRDDLTVTRFPTFGDLLHYMDGSAVPVGRAMTHILGVREPHTLTDALPGADALSIAMQLSNFWRDVHEDWHVIGRVYIPQEDLDRFGVTEADLAAGRVTGNYIRLMAFEFERTERYYEQARAAVPLLAAGRWGVMSGLEVYRSILTGIRRQGYDVFSRRPATGKARMLALILRARWRSLRQA